ncbi:MAG: aspartate-semialdehyde dehydrogenase [Desulfovibrionaceae bacterium]|nr:aspartate-semialdehyde dehydrogenase [Desulfovibrionaceae bacterium]
MLKPLRLAVVGATGIVGHELLKVLEDKELPPLEIIALGSNKALGSTVNFQEEELDVLALDGFDFTGVRLAFFCVPPDVSKQYVPKAQAAGCIVLDLSAAFRLEPNVPLCLPEINAEVLSLQQGLICQPNAVSIASALVLEPILDAVGLKSVGLTALISVSHAGRSGVRELEQQVGDLLNMREISCATFPEQIAFNLLPYVGAFLPDDCTDLEAATVQELYKILDEDTFTMSVSALQVPIFYGHSLTLYVETEKKLTAKNCRALLVAAPGISVLDNPDLGSFPSTLEAVGLDTVVVGRIREIAGVNGLNLVVSFDNLRKGAAVNAVQIFKELLTLQVFA